MAGRPNVEVRDALLQLINEEGGGILQAAAAGVPVPAAPENRNPEVDAIIQSIQDHKLKSLDEVLETTITCPAGAVFAAGIHFGPFPRMEYVGVSGDATKLKEETLIWTIRLATAYAHVRVAIPGQTPEVAMGLALAYYVMRKGSSGMRGAYDTDEAEVKAQALNWLKANPDLPMGLGRVGYEAPAGAVGGEEPAEVAGFVIDPQVAGNIFFLMALLSTHGQNITTDRIEKFLKAANSPLERVTAQITPDDIRKCWNGLDAGGAVNQTSFIRLAGIVYKYVKHMPTFSMGVPQSQLRGLTAFQMVARLHVEYAGADLREFWTICGLAELEAMREVFEQMGEKTAFMAIFGSLTVAASDRLKVSARMALEFLKVKDDLPRIDRYAGRWAKARMSPEMSAWVQKNRNVQKGGGQLQAYITVEQSAELAVAMSQSLQTVNFSGEQAR
ncbi:hypothetical protein [Beihai barnacle virus 9]|uniref:Nucleoprotein n=1 Tax=Beihai barnacle virus 9 TaxID=1922367 RepID=A0A1L3KMQ0_9VIRU|nr:hypothetical protein [Beihai barnacle virus 9]APG78654.1 hypothetical protein [Beihai barnacle virus 9]